MDNDEGGLRHKIKAHKEANYKAFGVDEVTNLTLTFWLGMLTT